MMAPGGGVFPTAVTEPFFVDHSFVMDRETFAGVGALIYRPDWPGHDRLPTWTHCQQKKLDALKNGGWRGWCAGVVAEQFERCRRGRAMLEDIARNAPTHAADYIVGLLAGAEARCWRVAWLLHELTGAVEHPGPRPDVRERLIRSYRKSLSPVDAQQLADWLLAGLP
jgi:hypothetical protein